MPHRMLKHATDRTVLCAVAECVAAAELLHERGLNWAAGVLAVNSASLLNITDFPDDSVASSLLIVKTALLPELDRLGINYDTFSSLAGCSVVVDLLRITQELAQLNDVERILLLDGKLVIVAQEITKDVGDWVTSNLTALQPVVTRAGSYTLERLLGTSVCAVILYDRRLGFFDLRLGYSVLRRFGLIKQ